MTDEPTPRPDLLDTIVQAGAALIPSFGGALALFAERERVRFHDRTRRFADEVLASQEQADLERLLGDERRANLITRAAMSVGITAWSEKRHAMAQVAAAVISGDDASLDDSELLVLALLDLDRPHVSLLVRIDRACVGRSDGILLSELEGVVHPSAVAGLDRHGAISDAGIDGGGAATYGGSLYGMTGFGRELLVLLDACH